MQLQPYVEQVQHHLSSAASLGDESTRRTADALAVATEPAVRLAVLAAVGAAADEITAALLDVPGSPAVTARLDGDEVRVEVRVGELAPADADPGTGTAVDADSDVNARISLRLSETLKGDIEAAARAESVSVNSWLVRAAGRALARTPHDTARSTHRLSGWVNG